MYPFAAAPVIVGHRGAPLVARENTPEAFAAAAWAGADWVELDARRAGDGVTVVHHDPSTPDGVPLVARPAAALRAAGVWTLEEILDGLPEGLGADVELKNLPGDPDYDENDPLAVSVAGVVGARAGQRPILVSSFNPLTLRAFGAALPAVPTGLLHPPTLRVAAAVTLATELGARVLCSHVDAPGLDARGIAEAHEAGLSVLVWTVDDPARARTLAAAGADALCTNDPGLLVQALRAPA